MSFEDRGKYVSILCLMHQQGRMKEETIRFLVGSISDILRAKFSVDDNGFWFNERLELEIQKRTEFTESRRNNGLKGGRPKASAKPNGYPLAKPNGKATGNHMGNENEDDIINKVEPDFFESNAQAYMLLSGNYHDTDAATKIIANNGWPAVNENEVKALIHHFIETQADVKKQDRSDIRQHLRRWLNKQPVDKMRAWAKTIIENHARRGQRQV